MTDARPPKRIRSTDAHSVNIPDAADSDNDIKLISNNLTRQGTFKDMSWETRRLQTEDEKKAEWSKDAEEMREEREAIRIQEAADQMDWARGKRT